MSTSAVVMMILAMLLLWGGMAAAILKLRGHPDAPEPPEQPRKRSGGAHRRT